MKVVLCGPRHSGKGCLRERLKQTIMRLPDAPYPYVITACPDGEGSWFQETVNRDPDLAEQLKVAYKSTFTPEFVRRVADSVTDCLLPLTLVDIGGIASAENETICATATHAIILAGDPHSIFEWHSFCQKIGLRVVAEIMSEYQATEDVVPSLFPDGIWRGSVHHLERGELVPERPTILALAQLLVTLVSLQLEG